MDIAYSIIRSTELSYDHEINYIRYNVARYHIPLLLGVKAVNVQKPASGGCDLRGS